MIKYIILSLFAVAAINTKAQVNLGIYGGVNVSNISYNNGSIDDASARVAGYHAGLIVDLGLAKVISIQTGLNLSQRGGKELLSTGNNTYSYAYRPMYIDIPVLLNIKIPIGGLAIHLAAGPYFSYGVAGTREATYNNVTISQKIDWNDIKRTDVGLRMQARVFLGTSFFVGAYYDQGLSNISNDNDYNSQNRNRYVSFYSRNAGLSIGIMMNKE